MNARPSSTSNQYFCARERNSTMKIQVLGTGCPKCKALTENVEKAIKQTGVDAEIEKVTDIAGIMSFGVMITPALVIDGEVKATGKLLSPDEIAKFLT